MAYKAKFEKRAAQGPRTFNGKPVEDAKNDQPFHVTKNDCSEGKRSDHERCAGAIALKRAIPGAVAVHLARRVIIVETKEKAIRFSTPRPVRDQVLRFDAGGDFDPGHYVAAKMPASQIKWRGRGHSAPDRKHGSPTSPNKRRKITHHLGRDYLRFTGTNSDFKGVRR